MSVSSTAVCAKAKIKVRWLFVVMCPNKDTRETIYGRIAKFGKALDCNSLIGGSSPPPTSIYRHSLMDRQRASTSYHLGSNPSGGAIENNWGN